MASIPEAAPQERRMRYNNGAVLLHWSTAPIGDEVAAYTLP